MYPKPIDPRSVGPDSVLVAVVNGKYLTPDQVNGIIAVCAALGPVSVR